jgi:hypothetical protein
MTDATMSRVGNYGNSPIAGSNAKPWSWWWGGWVAYDSPTTTGDKIIVSEWANADLIKESNISVDPANGGITTPTTAINNLQGTTNFPNGSAQNYAWNANYQTWNTTTW